MTLAVPPNAPARAEWLLAGLTDRATSHWVRAPLLDGDDDDDDAPDDDNVDIASLTGQQSTVVQLSKLLIVARSPLLAGCLLSDVSAGFGV